MISGHEPYAKSIPRIDDEHADSHTQGTSLPETHVTSQSTSPVSSDHDQEPELNLGDDLVEGEQAIPSVDEELYPHAPEPQSSTKWTKDYPHHQIIGDPTSGVKMRSAAANECLFANFLSMIEPRKISKALQDPNWIDAMQEQLF